MASPNLYVSRGGEKLSHAMKFFNISVLGKECIDVGSSTGGFADCLLQLGAETITCVDVGYGLLHEKVKSDDRVKILERTNIRSIPNESFTQKFDIVVADLSFISLTAVMKNILDLARDDGSIILLVKPQFEATKTEASKSKGVINDSSIWLRTITEVKNSAFELGGNVQDASMSPLPGKAGNREFFLLLSKQLPPQDIELARIV